MKRKIISILMAMVILLTTVDLTVFASEATLSGNEVQNVVEEVTDGGGELLQENDVPSIEEIENENIEDESVEDAAQNVDDVIGEEVSDLNH